MSVRARVFLALLFILGSQLLTPRMGAAQTVYRPPQSATPVPQNPPQPPKKSWWGSIWGTEASTSTPTVPNPSTNESITCLDCWGRYIRTTVTSQLNNLRDVVSPFLPYQTVKTDAAPSPPAASECGFLSPLVCLTQAYDFVTGGYTRLESIVMKHVTRPRQTSKTAQARGAPRVLAGDRTKGMCKQATNDFLVEAGLLCERIPGNHAFEAKNYLQNQLHLPNIESSIRRDPQGRIDPSTIPLNTILVYEDTRPPGRTRAGKDIPRSGHIEYKLSPEKYCSDFTSKFPISISNPQRRLIGAFRAPGCKR